jgi:hypothetical protein
MAELLATMKGSLVLEFEYESPAQTIAFATAAGTPVRVIRGAARQRSFGLPVLLPESTQVESDGSVIYLPEQCRFRNAAAFALWALQRFDGASVLRAVSWQNFEALVTELVSEAGGVSNRGFRWRDSTRKYEIDVVAQVGPHTVLCIDCKHWGHPTFQSLLPVATAQLNRVTRLAANAEATRYLCQKLQLDESHQKKLILIPVIVTSIGAGATENPLSPDGVPLVGFDQFPDFVRALGPDLCGVAKIRPSAVS